MEIHHQIVLQNIIKQDVLAFELISNKQKIICNSGYGKYLSTKTYMSLSRSTAAHSTLYINNTSSLRFSKEQVYK